MFLYILIMSLDLAKKKKYTDVKTTKNGNENFLGQLWKKHKVVFNFESCRLLQNISHKYDLLWILYLSIFLSTECKSTSASTNDMHGRLKAVTYQIRGFLCLYFFLATYFPVRCCCCSWLGTDRRIQGSGTWSQVHFSYWYLLESFPYLCPFSVYTSQRWQIPLLQDQK